MDESPRPIVHPDPSKITWEIYPEGDHHLEIFPVVNTEHTAYIRIHLDVMPFLYDVRVCPINSNGDWFTGNAPTFIEAQRMLISVLNEVEQEPLEE